MKKHVFIVGSKGIPAKYGGYETFVEYLTARQKDSMIQYHVACKITSKKNVKTRFVYNGADCFDVYVPQIGPAQAIYYDVAAIKKSLKYVKENNIQGPIFYILACRIGPFMSKLTKEIHRVGGTVYVNPDGHEWLRAKWSYPVRRYWKASERLMVKYADFLICDSKNIEKYIQSSYPEYHPNTTFIAYGAEVTKSKLSDSDAQIVDWLKKYNIKPHEYYLIVGRFVPENNYKTMINEFMKSTSTRDLVIITNVEHNSFYAQLKKDTHFDSDARIKFVGTVYDADFLKKIRELAFAYMHGHSVGGTNPSLLEALASTKVNLLYDIGFNHEVGEQGALYWNLDDGNLAALINRADSLSAEKIEKLSKIAQNRIREEYSWQHIVNRYETLLTSRRG